MNKELTTHIQMTIEGLRRQSVVIEETILALKRVVAEFNEAPTDSPELDPPVEQTVEIPKKGDKIKLEEEAFQAAVPQCSKSGYGSVTETVRKVATLLRDEGKEFTATHVAEFMMRADDRWTRHVRLPSVVLNVLRREMRRGNLNLISRKQGKQGKQVFFKVASNAESDVERLAQLKQNLGLALPTEKPDPEE